MTAPDRVVGVDVARCLALLGMMATHILPGVVDGEVPWPQQLAGGRASALFAVLAGLSLSLISGRRVVRGRDLRGVAAGTAVRAVAIALLGLLLGEVDSGIAVILVYYAVFFLLAIPFLALSTPALAAVALVWALAAPPASLLLRRELPPPTYDVPGFDALGEPVALLRDLLLTGYYPALTWLPYLLAGMAIGRLRLGERRTWGGLATVGAALVAVSVAVPAVLLGPDGRAALVRTFEGAGWQGDLATTLSHGLYGAVPTGSWWWLLVRAPHSGTTPDVLMTAGSALLVLAGCLVLGRLAPRVLAVAFGAGAATLTLYCLHVTLRGEGAWDGDDLPTYLGQAALVLVIGALLRLGGLRGPLEVLVGAPASAARRAVAGRRAEPPTVAP